MSITKEGIEVKVGQLWRDLDKRMDGRCRWVVQICPDGKVKMSQCRDRPYRRATYVSISRMHKHSTGWELVR